MKKCIILFFAVLGFIAGYAQRIIEDAKKNAQFAKNKLYVVYSGKPAYDSALRKAFTQQWVITPIAGFVTKEEANDFVDDKSNSFVITKEWEVIHTTIEYSYHYWAISALNGGKKKLYKYNNTWNALYNVTFNEAGAEHEIEKAAYRLPLMVHELNFYFTNGKRSVPITHALDHKILLINQNNAFGEEKWYRNVDTAALAVYKHKYQILPEEKIKELIDAKDGKYALLVPVRNNIDHTVFVFDLGTYDIIAMYSQKVSVFSRGPWVGKAAFSYLNDCVPATK